VDISGHIRSVASIPSQSREKKKGGDDRARKTSATIYSAFDSPTHPPLARLGVGVEWKRDALLQFEGAGGMTYRKSACTPRLTLNANVFRLPIVPGCDPKKTYGDLYMRDVRGIVLEAFGVGNMPWTKATGWIPWLRSQRKQGMLIYKTSQCESGKLHQELYRTGSVALELGAESGPMMTPECAVVKLMLCLAHPNLPPSQPIAGELYRNSIWMQLDQSQTCQLWYLSALR